MNILEPKLLILASAGSGKTYQLSNRIIGLIAQGADPERIVALTFTRKAAAEFADSMLTKLAGAAADPEAARDLAGQLQIEGADFAAVLARVTRSLHRITLGTMDSFFARIVRAFQYELGITGGRFELIEGPRQELAADAMLEHILGDVITEGGHHEFPHAFRRATMGRQSQGVAHSLREYVKHWHLRQRRHPDLRWGPDELLEGEPEDWEKHKAALCQRILDGLDEVDFSRKDQRKALEKSVSELVGHTIASGSLSDAASLTHSILEAAAIDQGGALTLRYHKEFTVEGGTAEALRQLARLAARCELDAAVLRTRAIHEVVRAYDRECERLLRSRGRLGFEDVKLMMEQWIHSEEARLRRESIDFRLDSRTDHWLLDEFQDTSRSEWNGLLPLVDEAATDGDFRTIFVVGDRKQAIYGWRGGDVTLFDEVIARYSPELKIAPLDVSWRSCPQVLALVNRVCGDRALVSGLFGEAGDGWDCPEHRPAAPLGERKGHARVEIVDGWEAKFERIEEMLHQLGVGRRQLTCGILLRGNEQAAKVAAELRGRGFDVILEGQREPGRDNPVGVAVGSLLRWIADPGNSLARGVVAMSPLHSALQLRHGESWEDIWSGLGADLACRGHEAVIRELCDGCGVEWSEFSRRRIEDLLQVLGDFDRRGVVSPREIAETVARLKISQSPGMAAIQVMTIHKSKGLGFDVVILPEIPGDGIPEVQRFRVAQGPDWVCETPPAWARRFHPLMVEAERQWAAAQRHEALCVLYVALTRAKRGLYVLLDPPSKNHDPGQPSLANWMLQATEWDPEKEGPCFEEGSFDWALDLPEADAPQQDDGVGCALRPPSPMPEAAGLSPLTPSRQGRHRTHSASGMAFGRQVHSLLESVGWIDEQPAEFPAGDAAQCVARVLADPSTRTLFERSGRRIRLLREQAADAVIDGQWVSGIIDRLHLHEDADGTVTQIEIIDFKTDAVEDPEALRQAYQGQLHAYRDCLARLHPAAETRCLLLSTHLAQVIEC